VPNPILRRENINCETCEHEHIYLLNHLSHPRWTSARIYVLYWDPKQTSMDRIVHEKMVLDRWLLTGEVFSVVVEALGVEGCAAGRRLVRTSVVCRQTQIKQNQRKGTNNRKINSSSNPSWQNQEKSPKWTKKHHNQRI